MEHHPAVALLRAGCLKLQIPLTAAVELVRFLFLKRLTGDERGSKLSPSAMLDRLWHWMLLESAVHDAVSELTGRVWHTQETAGLLDASKIRRRLRTLTLFAREFAPPQLPLWEQPGTPFAGIRAIPVEVDGLQGEGFVQYVCGSTTEDQLAKLLEDEGYDVDEVRTSHLK
jgi:hypothetical protein